MSVYLNMSSYFAKDLVDSDLNDKSIITLQKSLLKKIVKKISELLYFTCIITRTHSTWNVFFEYNLLFFRVLIYYRMNIDKKTNKRCYVALRGGDVWDLD